ncbi:MAG: DNA ligase [Mariprofundaceae bacterium]|nr:DNA ligase [Mariprofundaceae bacterium]
MKFLILILSLCFALPAFAQSDRDILLLKTWQPSRQVKGWLMSEKLDGVRAYWDGHQLLSRSGLVFAAPTWFTKDFPPFELDGELWTKRGDFEQIVSIVRRQQAHDGWKRLSYRIFEVPHQSGGLLARLDVLKAYLADHPHPYLHIIEQKHCKNQSQLKRYLQQLVSQGAEGVVVRNPAAPYQTGRSSDVLKLKNYRDTECTIVGYKPGKGQLKGQTGALLCRMLDGAVISIGSGLNQVLRKSPPALGQVVTFKYYGLTKNGKPRHPVFLHLRQKL